MNAMPKLVASRSLERADAWSNSRLVSADLVDEVRAATQDLVVAGSASVVRTLMEHDLVDEYRLLVFPLVLGAGRRLFEDGAGSIALELVSAEPAGAAALQVYRRAR
jgi:dihydrofolate reductase